MSSCTTFIGPFREVYKDLKEAVNCGFPQKQHLLALITGLFVGAVIQAKNFALLITSYKGDPSVPYHHA